MHWSSKIIWQHPLCAPVMPKFPKKKKRKKWIWKRTYVCNGKKPATNRIINSHIARGISWAQFHSMFIGQIFYYLRVAALFTRAFLFMENNTRIVMYGYGCVCVLKVVAPLFCGVWMLMCKWKYVHVYAMCEWVCFEAIVALPCVQIFEHIWCGLCVCVRAVCVCMDCSQSTAAAVVATV